MKFKNMGTFDAGVVTSSPTGAAAPHKYQTMDAAAIANGGAFLQSELENGTTLSVSHLPASPMVVISQ